MSLQMSNEHTGNAKGKGGKGGQRDEKRGTTQLDCEGKFCETFFSPFYSIYDELVF